MKIAKNILNKEKLSYILVIVLSIVALYFINIANQYNINKSAELKKNIYGNADLSLIKNFILGKIDSPFTHVEHKVKKNETIVSILKKKQNKRKGNFKGNKFVQKIW